MSTPIIILAGEAGSGKDTVGNHIAKRYNGICLGQADPMKRFCNQVFGFTSEQLWGPTETRNAPVGVTPDRFLLNRANFREHGLAWLTSVVPAGTNHQRAHDALCEWFARCEDEIMGSHTITPRFALQTLGTEWGRSISRNMWNELGITTAKELLSGRCDYSRETGLVKSSNEGYDYAMLTDGRFRNEIINTTSSGGVAFKVWRPNRASLTAGITGHQSETELGRIPRHFFTEVLDNTGTLQDLYDLVDTNMAIYFGDDRARSAA